MKLKVVSLLKTKDESSTLSLARCHFLKDSVGAAYEALNFAGGTRSVLEITKAFYLDN